LEVAFFYNPKVVLTLGFFVYKFNKMELNCWYLWLSRI